MLPLYSAFSLPFAALMKRYTDESEYPAPYYGLSKRCFLSSSVFFFFRSSSYIMDQILNQSNEYTNAKQIQSTFANNLCFSCV